MANPVSVLPRYFALKGDNNMYLQLKPNDPGFLTFDAPAITRLTTHEVLYNSDDASGSFIIRSANQHFWRRDASGGWIRADRDPSNIPSASDTAARFKLVEDSSGQLALQSAAADGLYLKRFQDSKHGYAALVSTPDKYSFVEVTQASQHAVSLPRYILLKGDNQKYMHSAWFDRMLWLQFRGEDNDTSLDGVSEVFPLVDGNLVLFNLQTKGYWWTSDGQHYIHLAVDHNLAQARANIRCHFEPLKLSSTLLALRSKLNNKFCKRYTNGARDSLSAITDDISDIHAFLTVSDASIRNQVFDVRYILSLASTTDQRPLAVAFGSVTNNSSFTTDMTVHVTRTSDMSTSYTFSNSFSFSQSISTSFKAGMPFLAGSLDVHIGLEQSFSREWNTTTSSALEFGTSYLVKDIPPGAQATVTVMCSFANMRIPFTYKSITTAPTGADRPSEEHVDGMYEGVEAYKFDAVIDNGTGTTYTISILPTKEVDL